MAAADANANRHRRDGWGWRSGNAAATLFTPNTAAPPPAGSNGGEMLVLTRKTNQSIMIGDEIEVSVLAVSRDKIRLGITAPREVPVFRKEVYLSIQEEQMGADGDASEHVDKALDKLSNDSGKK
jgi:carbon storage regulator